MKKVLYIVSTLKKTGPIIVLANIIKYLDRNKFEPIILTLSPEPNNSMKDHFHDYLDVRIYTLGLSRIQSLFFASNKLKLFFKENNIDIIHSHGFRADSLTSKLSNIKNIATLHNYPFYDYPMKFGKLKGEWMAMLHLKTIKNQNKINIACAKTISNEFKQHNLSLQYIQNGVDTEKFKCLNKDDIYKLKIKLKISSDKKIFITVGSLISRKDMETVIKGFKLFNSDKTSILLIAGEGPEKENLQFISDDNIVFLGNISNVVEYLQISDCFISASLAEGLPNTVLEAMACGLPTILSDIPSHRELYENEKVEIFSIKDDIKLSKLLKIIDLAKQKEISLKLINNHFSAKSMSEKYQKIYGENS